MKTVVVYLKGRELIFELNNMKFSVYRATEHNGKITTLFIKVNRIDNSYHNKLILDKQYKPFKNFVKHFFTQENLIQLILKHPHNSKRLTIIFRMVSN